MDDPDDGEESEKENDDEGHDGLRGLGVRGFCGSYAGSVVDTLGLIRSFWMLLATR